MTYNIQKYWENRLAKNYNLIGVGYHSFNLNYNLWLYRAKEKALNKVIKKHRIDLNNKAILDIGCGTGFFVNFYKKHKVKLICGIDITRTSVSKLQKSYPKFIFKKLDIGEKLMHFEHKFDIINVFDVVYHITDNKKFETAIHNIKNACHRNSYIFITDQLATKDTFTSDHALLRGLHTYKKIFKKLNLEIINIIPMYFFLNRPLKPKNKKITRLIRKIGNKIPYVFYFFDCFLTQLPIRNNNLKLLVAKPKSN